MDRQQQEEYEEQMWDEHVREQVHEFWSENIEEHPRHPMEDVAGGD
jgi:hypothetical protein